MRRRLVVAVSLWIAALGLARATSAKTGATARRWARGSPEVVDPAGDPDRGITPDVPIGGVAARIAESPRTASLDSRNGTVDLARARSIANVAVRPSVGTIIGDLSSRPVMHPADAHP